MSWIRSLARRALPPLAVVLLSIGSLGAAEGDTDVLDAVYQHPTADGMLITLTTADGQANALGIRPGDILVSYGNAPIPDLAALRAAVTTTTAGPIPVTVQRGAERLQFTLQPGKLGVTGEAVRDGVDSGKRAKRKMPLPPATAIAFDFSRLAKGPVDTWHEFHFGDHDEHCGFEHYTLSLAPARAGAPASLTAIEDFAFHGAGMPVFGGYLLVESTAEPTPVQLRTHSEDNDGSDPRDAFRGVDAHGAPVWVLAKGVPGSAATPAQKQVAVPAAPLMQSALIGCFMPREKGACFHYSFLIDGVPAELALRAEREETIELPDHSRHHAWAYQMHGDQGPAILSWVDDDGILIKNEFGAGYGGAWSVIATRDAALAGLDPEIRVRGVAGKAQPEPPKPADDPGF